MREVNYSTTLRVYFQPNAESNKISLGYKNNLVIENYVYASKVDYFRGMVKFA